MTVSICTSSHSVNKLMVLVLIVCQRTEKVLVLIESQITKKLRTLVLETLFLRMEEVCTNLPTFG